MSPHRRGLRRRLDAWGLRMQARLDAAWADRTLPWIVGAVLFAVLFGMALAVVRQMEGGPGLAVWTQSAWSLRSGYGAASTLSGTDPVADQWSFVAYPVLWLSTWIPTQQLLAAVQALALALTVVPLWRLARTVYDLRLGTTAAVVGAFALAPAVHAANLSFFRPEVIAVPAMAGAMLFWKERRWVPYALCVLLVLLCRADLGVTVAALGLLLLIDGERTQGLATMAIGVVWSAAAVAVLDPALPEGVLTASQAAAAQGITPLAELRSLFTDPATVLGDLVSQRSVPLIVSLFAPLLFLPVTAPRTLLPAVPPLLLGISAARAVQDAAEVGVASPSPASANVLVAVVPITVAALVALSRIGRRSVTRINVDHRLVGALVVASLVLFVQDAPTSPYQQPWAWGGRDEVDQSRLMAVSMVSDTAAVTVSPQIGPEVAERRVVRETWVGPPSVDDPWTPTTDAVILDTTGTDVSDNPLWDDPARRRVVAGLSQQGYAVRYSWRGIYVFERSQE